MGEATLDKMIEVSNSLTFVKDANVAESLNAGDERNDRRDDGERNGEERNDGGEESACSNENEEQREVINEEGNGNRPDGDSSTGNGCGGRTCKKEKT